MAGLGWNEAFAPDQAVERWVDVVRAVLREAGLVRVKEGVEEMEARALVIFDGQIVEVDSLWQVIRPAFPYWAIGSGQHYAIAAMQAMQRVGVPSEPRERLQTAMEVAATFDPAVRPPFEVLEGVP